MTDALLPCPFCGGKVYVYKADCEDASDRIQHDTGYPPCGIEAFGNFYHDADVITLWNTRAKLDLNRNL